MLAQVACNSVIVNAINCLHNTEALHFEPLTVTVVKALISLWSNQVHHTWTSFVMLLIEPMFLLQYIMCQANMLCCGGERIIMPSIWTGQCSNRFKLSRGLGLLLLSLTSLRFYSKFSILLHNFCFYSTINFTSFILFTKDNFYLWNATHKKSKVIN